METKSVKGSWKQVRQDAMNQWEKLTERDLDRLEASIEDMIDTMQRRYKYSRRKAEKEVRHFARQYTTAMDNVKANVENTVEQAQNATQQTLRRARRTVARRPLQALAAAMALGLALGLLVIPIQTLRK